MKKFKVFVRSSDILCKVIYANSKEQAEEIAEELDGGEFESTCLDALWEIVPDYTEEVK